MGQNLLALAHSLHSGRRRPRAEGPARVEFQRPSGAQASRGGVGEHLPRYARDQLWGPPGAVSQTVIVHKLESVEAARRRFYGFRPVNGFSSAGNFAAFPDFSRAPFDETAGVLRKRGATLTCFRIGMRLQDDGKDYNRCHWVAVIDASIQFSPDRRLRCKPLLSVHSIYGRQAHLR